MVAVEPKKYTFRHDEYRPPRIVGDPYGLESGDESITTQSIETANSSQQLKRSLKGRHLAMISLGGVIGQGLFLSSGANLHNGGPAGALIAYAIIGFMVFWVAYSVGEMSTYIPVSGSFTIFCRRFVDTSFGATIGYNYWACWAIIVASELVALPLIMNFWTDRVPDWAWSFLCLVVIFVVNLFGARSYGETEYWFSLIKVLAVIIFIIVGCLVSGGLIGGQVYGFNYWTDGGAFPHGITGVTESLVQASFSMQGTEFVGITAGEAGNPRKDVPRAIKNVLWRVIIFYLCSVLVMGMVIRWDDSQLLNFGYPAAEKVPSIANVGSDQLLEFGDAAAANATHIVGVSPFTIVFEKGTLGSVAHIMNAIILVTVLSCANSGLYVASRTLLALSEEGIAWSKLSYISEHGVPVYALICTSLVSLIACATSFIPGTKLFWVLTNLSGVAGLVTWAGICFAHLRFRKAFKKQSFDKTELPMRAPLHPFGDLFDLTLCTLIALVTGVQHTAPPDAARLIGSYGGLFLCLVGFLATKFYTGSKMIPLDEIDLQTGRADIPGEQDDQLVIQGPWYNRLWKHLVFIFT